MHLLHEMITKIKDVFSTQPATTFSERSLPMVEQDFRTATAKAIEDLQGTVATQEARIHELEYFACVLEGKPPLIRKVSPDAMKALPELADPVSDPVVAEDPEKTHVETTDPTPAAAAVVEDTVIEDHEAPAEVIPEPKAEPTQAA